MQAVSEATDRDRVIGMITGAWKTQAIGEGVKLGLFDQLGAGEASASALAVSVGANADGVMRLLRGLAVLGLVRHEGGERFSLTSLGEYLRRDTPDSLSGLSGHWGGRMWDSFGSIGMSVLTGEASTSSGPEHFAEQQADIESADVFNRAMAEGSLRVGRALAKAYDFSGITTVRDVGGGYGALLVGPLEANPTLHGEVFDLPTLGEVALAFLDRYGVSGRVDYIGGSFFDSVPTGADCILLKFILHDWNDANSLIILENCRNTIGAGRILILERIVPEVVGAADEDVIRGDLTMMTVGGKERTEVEYRELLGKAGLEIIRIIEVDAVYSAIEARVR